MILASALTDKITSFLVGLASGIILICLIYLLFILFTVKKFQKKTSPKFALMDKRELALLIKYYQEEYIKRSDDAEKKFLVLIQINKELIKDIASKFAPKSTKPYYELTLDECIKLLNYISKRLDSLLNQKMIKRFRKLTIKKIMDLREMEKKVKNSNLAQATKLSGMSKFLKVLKMLNPVHWFKEVLIEPIINKVILEITLNSIAIVAEETYLIYSKRAFSSEDSEINNLSIDDIYNIVSNELGDEKDVPQK